MVGKMSESHFLCVYGTASAVNSKAVKTHVALNHSAFVSKELAFPFLLFVFLL